MTPAEVSATTGGGCLSAGMASVKCPPQAAAGASLGFRHFRQLREGREGRQLREILRRDGAVQEGRDAALRGGGSRLYFISDAHSIKYKL